MGVPGDVKAVTVIEDTAVALAKLPVYVRRIQALMEKYQTRCVYYGHASVGLLHLRPELNLKQPEGIEKFKALAADVADLVAEFGGSLSGEHGDGRLRGPFVARILGKEIYEILCRIKSVFDPEGIFNPHKVTAAFAIDRDLRVKAPRTEIPVYFDWSADQGFLRAADKCNGAGACRKRAGRGTMCPSYMATLEEKHSTRGRANVFRQVLNSPDPLAGLTSGERREVSGSLSRLQGVQIGVPGGRRYGTHEGRVPAALSGSPRRAAAGARLRRVRAAQPDGSAFPGRGNGVDQSHLGKAAARDPRRAPDPGALARDL